MNIAKLTFYDFFIHFVAIWFIFCSLWANFMTASLMNFIPLAVLSMFTEQIKVAQSEV